MCLQVAEAALMDVRVEGSLLVHADSVMGSMEAPWEAAAAAAARNPNDIHISHPDGTQTLYPAAEPGASSQAPPPGGHSSGAPLFSDGRLHLQVPVSRRTSCAHNTCVLRISPLAPRCALWAVCAAFSCLCMQEHAWGSAPGKQRPEFV